MGEPKIIFSNHAERQLLERGISKGMVKYTIASPQKLINFHKKYYAYKQFGILYLKVVFVRVGEGILIITQHFVKKLP